MSPILFFGGWGQKVGVYINCCNEWSRTKILMKNYILLIVCLFLVACQGEPTEIAEVPTTEIVEASVEQPATATRDPNPPTATPRPSRTAVPTATPTIIPSLSPSPTPSATNSPVLPSLTPTISLSPTRRPPATPQPRKEEPITPVPVEWLVPLTDLGTGTYQGFEGGLYPGGVNEMPASHLTEGLRRAQLIQPLDWAGNPDPNGKIGMLALGMSNTTQEFCGSRQVKVGCHPWTFIGQAEQDPTINHANLVLIDGARGGQVAHKWDGIEQDNWARVNETILPELGVSQAQVQVAWVKVANPGPRFTLPSDRADAYILVQHMAGIVRALQHHYPNIQQVYISSRIFAGYANTTLNPEPYAYEYGFSVKWLIEAQINQMATGEVDPRAGDLSYDGTAPWLAWGPYFWANSTPRSDGLFWEPVDFDERDFTHPSTPGETKVANMLMDYFRNSRTTRCWFLVEGLCN